MAFRFGAPSVAVGDSSESDEGSPPSSNPAGWEQVPERTAELARTDSFGTGHMPVIVERAGGQARKRFLEFFTATIRNENTRVAYARAVGAFFEWCRSYRLELIDIESNEKLWIGERQIEKRQVDKR